MGISRTVSKILVENCKFSPPRVFYTPLKGFPLELGIGTRSQKARMLLLPDGPKGFKIDLAIYTQYWRVTDRQPARPTAILQQQRPRYAERRAGKTQQDHCLALH